MPDHSLIRDDEQLDDLDLNGLLLLQKKSGFRYGMDAVLLADFAGVRPNDHTADFGTGTGILPLLLYGRGKGKQFDAFEIQQDMAQMAERTMRLNGLQNTIRVHPLPVQRAEEVLPRCSVDSIVCNPPYGISGATLVNPSEPLALARHQTADGLVSWLRTAHLLLKGKGRLDMIYPAPRMLQLMELMEQAHLTPKRFRLIYPREDKPANLVLIEAMKDGKPMLHPEPPLIVYRKDGSPTDETCRIYHMKSVHKEKQYDDAAQ